MNQNLKSITRKRSSVIVVHNEQLLTVEAIDPTSGQNYLFVPGGQIEANEAPEVCAIRETLEETGYQIRLTAQSPILSEYDFNWDGRIHHCETLFFAGELATPQSPPVVVHDAPYIRGTKWIDLTSIPQHFAYSDAILQAILLLLPK